MLYYLSSLAQGGGFFNLFNYLTVRAGGALLTSLFLCLMFGRPLIDWLRVKQKKGQPIRADGPQTHLVEKVGTPTMGGVMILGALTISTLLWAKLGEGFVWVALLSTLGFGAIGFWDDFLKVSKRNTKGAPGKARLAAGLLVAFGAALATAMLTPEPHSGTLSVPFFKDFMPNLGLFYYPFAIFVILGAANSVNFTDGLDGLAIMPVIIAAGAFAIICYVVGRTDWSGYLHLVHVPGTGEITVFCAAIIGAGLGFLWYNAPPAMVFMGDTGSLALGGALGSVAVATKHEIVLGVIGGLFVMETMSVIIQVFYFKRTGKRVFRMAPIHHHFEQKGWKEPTIVIRFWIISLVLALIGLATLKLR